MSRKPQLVRVIVRHAQCVDQPLLLKCAQWADVRRHAAEAEGVARGVGRGRVVDRRDHVCRGGAPSTPSGARASGAAASGTPGSAPSRVAAIRRHVRRRHAAAAHVGVVVGRAGARRADRVARSPQIVGFMRPSPVGPWLLSPVMSPIWCRRRRRGRCRRSARSWRRRRAQIVPAPGPLLPRAHHPRLARIPHPLVEPARARVGAVLVHAARAAADADHLRRDRCRSPGRRP